MTLLLVWLLACAPVPAWDRDRLMSRPMAVPVDPCEAAMDAHFWGTREAMTGAVPGEGAACGCN
jgi:hypothetical protein